MKNINETISLIDSLDKEFTIRKDLEKNSVGNARHIQLAKVKEFLKIAGFPLSEEDRFKCSLVPLIFQEANYDDLNWTKQNADLRQLRSFFSLDFSIQNNGREQSDANEQEYKDYVRRSLAAIDYWKKVISEKKLVWS